MKINFHLLVSQKEALENDITMTKSILDGGCNELYLKSATMHDLHEALSENCKRISSLRAYLDFSFHLQSTQLKRGCRKF